MKKNHDLAWNVFLVISFLPFLGLLIYSTIAYFTGNMGGLLNQTPISGWDAFGETFFWGFLSLCVIPVFPAAIIYQIVYLVSRARRKDRGQID